MGDLLRASAPPQQPVLVPASRFAMGDDPNVLPPIVAGARAAGAGDFTLRVPAAGPGADEFAFTEDDLKEMAKQAATPLPSSQSPAAPQNASSGPGASAPVPGRVSGAAGGTQFGEPLPLELEIAPPSSAIRWVSRIRVMEAYRFDGKVAKAPHWVDRNWVGYADEDYGRGIPAGPCLRVPLPNAGQPHDDDEWHAICRVGDYITLQQYLSPDRAPFTQREVWPKEQFERVFMAEIMSSRQQRSVLEVAAQDAA